MSTVLFPDVEAVLVGWLPGALAAHDVDVPVSTRIPNPRPASFVRILRTGGPSHDVVVDAAQVTIECWAATTTAAAELARIVRAVLNGIRNTVTDDGHVLYGLIEFSGPAFLPDVSEQPRCSWTVQVHVRGQSL